MQVNRRLARAVAVAASTAVIATGLPLVVPSVAAQAATTQAGSPQLWGWGDNSQFQLGDKTQKRHYAPAPASAWPDSYTSTDAGGNGITVPMGPIAQVAMGTDNTIVRNGAGQVFGVGGYSNSEAGVADQFGDPQQIGLIDPTNPATDVFTSTANETYYLLKDGSLFGFGSNNNHLLGNNTATGLTDGPHAITGGVLQASCGGEVCIALKKVGATNVLWGWGDATGGEFGEGTTTSSHPLPVQLTTTIPNAVQVAESNAATAVLDSAGVVHTFGANREGELGTGTASTTPTNTPTTAVFPAGTVIKAISTYLFGFYALDSNGHVWAWGYAGASALGTGNNGTSPVFESPTPAMLTTDSSGNTLPTFSKVIGGDRDGYAISTSGVLYAWGDDGQSQLGQGQQASLVRPTIVPLPRAVIDVAATKVPATESAMAVLAPVTGPQNRSQGVIAAQVHTKGSAVDQLVESDGTGAYDAIVVPSGAATRAPALSPDGAQLAFASWRVVDKTGTATDDIFTATTGQAAVYGGSMTKATNNPSVASENPTWWTSAPGTFHTVAYETALGGGSHIQLGEADGTGTKYDLTPAGGNDHRPVFSKDGKQLFFTRGTGAGALLMVGDYDGTAHTLSNLTPIVTGNDAAISYDGTKLAWDSASSSQVNVGTWNPATRSLSGAHRVASTLTTAFTPTWSPDGTTLLVAGVQGTGTTAIHDAWKVDPTTGALITGSNGLYGGRYDDVRLPSWADNVQLTQQAPDVLPSYSNPRSVPVANLTQNGLSPQVTGCTNTTQCGDVIAAPGNNPGHTPGNNPGHTPGNNPGHLPGNNPGHTPGNNPGRAPGSNPNHTPGNNPGHTPGNNPGHLPGHNPGTVPGNNPGRGPGNNPSRGAESNGGEAGLTNLTDPNDLGSNPMILAGLSQISLASTPLVGGWASVLAGTPLAGKPLQSVTWRDYLSLSPVPNVSYKDLDFDTSPLGKISLLSYELGNTRLSDIGLHGPVADDGTFQWESFCTDLQTWAKAHGRDTVCDDYGRHNPDGTTLSGGFWDASLLALEIEGVPTDAFPGLSNLTLGDVDLTWHDGVLGEYPLSGLDLAHSSFGNVKVKDLAEDPAFPGDPTHKAAIDCSISGVICSATSVQTLYGAAQAAARAVDVNGNHYATVFRGNTGLIDLGHAADSLTFSEVISAIAQDLITDSIDTIPLDKLGVLGASSGQFQPVALRLGYSPIGVYGAVNPTVSVTLPVGFSLTTAYPGAQIQVSNITKQIGDPVVTGSATTGQTVTWTTGATVQSGQSLFIDFYATPGDTLGSFAPINATVTSGDVTESIGHSSPPIAVTENPDIATSTVSAPAIIAPNQLVLGHLPAAGKSDYFAIPAPAIAGSTMDVFLDHLPIDADLIVYHPAVSEGSVPLRPVPTNGAGAVQVTPDQVLGLASAAESVTPESLNDYPLAAGLPLAGVSDNRGLGFEHVSAITFGTDPTSGLSGDYIIQVTPHGNATSSAPFALRVTSTPPLGLPDVPRVAFPSSGTAGTTPAAPTTAPTTLILTDQKRLQQVYGATRAATALTAINQLAANSTVNGLVVPVEGWSDVQAAYDRWDAHPGEPEYANNVVRLINAHVDALLGSGRSSLRNIVVAGTDEIIPMARIADLTQTANERDFSGEVQSITSSATNGNNALISSTAAGYVLSDDPYASFAPRPFLGTFIYPPNVAIGRLVETPEDIAGVITQFLTPTSAGDAPGVLHPTTGLVTGYDFFAKMAQDIQASLTSTLSGTVSSLINGTWGRGDLLAAYNNKSPLPDVANLNAHATPGQLFPANGQSPYTSSDLAAAAGSGATSALLKKILFTLGCHSGFSITDYLSTGSAADFPQVTAHGLVAAFIGQTGYGLGGEPGTVAYGEQILENFAKDIKGRTLGTALAQAKLDYLAKSPNVYDAKALEEATFYGLPMFTIGGTATTTTVTPPSTSTDSTTGLKVASVSISNPIQSGDNWRLNTTSDGSYYTLANQVQGNDGNLSIEQHRPVEPREDLDVTEPNLTARGVLVTGLTTTDSSGFDPLLNRPTVDSATQEPEQQVAGVTWPLSPQDLGTVPTLAGGQKQTASFTLGRFRANGIAVSGASTGKTVGEQRRITNLGATVYYSAPNATTAANPVLSVTPTASGSGTTFAVTASAAPGHSIKRVLVLAHTTSGNGAWTPVELTYSSTNQDWEGSTSSVGGAYLEYIAQAVDDQGDVGVTVEQGADYVATTTGGGTDPGTAPSTTTLTSDRTSVAYGQNVTFAAQVTSPGSTISPSGSVQVSKGGTAVCTAVLQSGTGFCTASGLPVGVGSYSATFSATGFAPSTSSTVVITVTKAPLTVTADNQSRAYGSTNPALTFSYSGFANGESSSVLTTAPTCSTTATATSAPGTYPITCTGGAASNYTFSYVAGTLTVTTATLTVTASNATKSYGTVNPAITATYSGFVNGDTAASLSTKPTCSSTAGQFSAVGGYATTCTGGASSKYAFTYVGGLLTINPIPLTVNGPSVSKVYGAANPALAPAYFGFVWGDSENTLTTKATCTSTADATAHVGPHTVTCSGASSPNYSPITYTNGTLTVTPKALTVSSASTSRTYGAANPVLPPAYSGFVNGDTAASAVSTDATCTSTASTTSAVGSYPITCSGLVSNDYSGSYATGSTLTVTKAPLTITGSSPSKVYGSANPTITPVYSGLLNGDTGIQTAPTCSTTATASSTVGGYATSCSGGSATNYALSYATGLLTIQPAPLAITASNASRQYGASSNPAITVASFSGFVNGDTSASLSPGATCTTAAVATTPAGSFPTTCSGAANPNYTIAFIPGTLTITRAPVVVTASNGTRYFGTANPSITPSYSGLLNGEDSSVVTTPPTCGTTATATSAVGSYPTTCSGAAAANYTFSYVSGTLTVTKAPTVLTQTPVSVLGSTQKWKVTYTAVLKNAATGTGISGQTVSFSASNSSTGSAACSGTTDSTGKATCTSSLLQIAQVVVNGSTTASYAGSSSYLSTTNTTPYAVS